ncbi:hypothetical protein KSP40_PGU000468 [Platanthera guangdongensis]|uniref:sucrose synthase n=1 Tax=Platanthera guangdongensis TaxID=2320717 RepID=A0ABR2LUX1_9ASPA
MAVGLECLLSALGEIFAGIERGVAAGLAGVCRRRCSGRSLEWRGAVSTPCTCTVSLDGGGEEFNLATARRRILNNAGLHQLQPAQANPLSRGYSTTTRYTWKLYSERLMTLSGVYGFWKYVSNLDRRKTKRYLEMFYALKYRNLAQSGPIHSDGEVVVNGAK